MVLLTNSVHLYEIIACSNVTDTSRDARSFYAFDILGVSSKSKGFGPFFCFFNMVIPLAAVEWSADFELGASWCTFAAW